MSKLFFIGAGKMATAIASGLGSDKSLRIKAFDISAAAAEAFTARTSYPVSPTPEDALEGADAVLLAVKPQFAAEALDRIAPLLKGKLLISIVAGWPLALLEKHAKTGRIVRVMPNTPALAGEGMSCFAPAEAVREQDIARVEAVLSSVGKVRRVPEKLLDAVTGLSGSGPAFVMEFIMGLADGGVCCGLPRTLALESAVQTVLGTAKMCQESGRPIAELRDAVISPAGTTACGILAMQKAGFKGIAASAVIEAARRSAELGKKE